MREGSITARNSVEQSSNNIERKMPDTKEYTLCNDIYKKYPNGETDHKFKIRGGHQ